MHCLCFHVIFISSWDWFYQTDFLSLNWGDLYVITCIYIYIYIYNSNLIFFSISTIIGISRNKIDIQRHKKSWLIDLGFMYFYISPRTYIYVLDFIFTWEKGKLYPTTIAHRNIRKDNNKLSSNIEHMNNFGLGILLWFMKLGHYFAGILVNKHRISWLLNPAFANIDVQ